MVCFISLFVFLIKENAKPLTRATSTGLSKQQLHVGAQLHSLCILPLIVRFSVSCSHVTFPLNATPHPKCRKNEALPQELMMMAYYISASAIIAWLTSTIFPAKTNMVTTKEMEEVLLLKLRSRQLKAPGCGILTPHCNACSSQTHLKVIFQQLHI